MDETMFCCLPAGKKDQLTSATGLAHYNPNPCPSIWQLYMYIMLQHNYGIGAVISHIFPVEVKGQLQHLLPIDWLHLRKLCPAWKKGVLSLIILCIPSKSFISTCTIGTSNLITDHKPHTTTLGPKKGILSLAAAHLQMWAILFVSLYNSQVKPIQQLHHCIFGSGTSPWKRILILQHHSWRSHFWL